MTLARVFCKSCIHDVARGAVSLLKIKNFCTNGKQYNAANCPAAVTETPGFLSPQGMNSASGWRTTGNIQAENAYFLLASI